jgi:hypothetical protein
LNEARRHFCGTFSHQRRDKVLAPFQQVIETDGILDYSLEAAVKFPG